MQSFIHWQLRYWAWVAVAMLDLVCWSSALSAQTQAHLSPTPSFPFLLIPHSLRPWGAFIMPVVAKPLPELPPRYHNSPSIFGAYPQILKLERSEQAAYSCNPSNKQCKRLVYIRILGYLILEGPSDLARVTVALEVNACSGNEEKMLDIGRLYFDHFIRACKLQCFASESFLPF